MVLVEVFDICNMKLFNCGKFNLFFTCHTGFTTQWKQFIPFLLAMTYEYCLQFRNKVEVNLLCALCKGIIGELG